MTDPLFISESGQMATRIWFHHYFRHMLSLSGILPVNYSGRSFRIKAAASSPVMASQNTSYDSWTAGPLKCITATSVQISKISDLHNLIPSDGRFLGIHRCPGAAVDSLQNFPTTHSMNQCFVFCFCILLTVWSLLVN